MTATGPGVYRNTLPAWGDRNLLDLAQHIRSPLFLGHVRAATGTPVEQSNCHPFRHGNWLFQHNGFIEQHLELRRELLLTVDPSLFPSIDGTTDSQLLFFLALTFGLEDDPLGALERMAGFVEDTGRGHGIAEPLQMTIAVSDGDRLYAARYASGPFVNSLFVSEDARVRSARSTPTTSASRCSRTNRAWSSPSRSAICPASGARSRPAPRSSSSPARTWRSPSRPRGVPELLLQ